MGHDVHQLVDGRKLIIGGVKIPHEQGLLGHSDADVLVHAVCDALLGAAHLGDIGVHFPDSDSAFKDIDSLVLLQQVGHMIAEKGYNIINLDATVFAQAPKLGSFRREMETNLARTLAMDSDCVNVKFTTTEHLGFVGEGRGIEASAVVLLHPKD
jgi:2-C-methyl-D-erythritol 2,4-cyclodiphosphate synthase